MNPLFVVFDAALAVLALRSIAVLRTRAPWTCAGWVGTAGYCAAAIVEFSHPAARRAAGAIAYVLLLALAIAFVIASMRDEPSAEPWWWPMRAGRTRAQKRG